MTQLLLNEIHKEGIKLKVSIRHSLNGAFSLGINNNQPTIYLPSEPESQTNTYYYSLAHELAHWKYIKKLKGHRQILYFNRRNKWRDGKIRNFFYIWLDEINAWIIGYRLCRKFKVETKGYLQHAWKYFKTYLSRPVNKTLLINKEILHELEKECRWCFFDEIDKGMNYCPHCGKSVRLQ